MFVGRRVNLDSRISFALPCNKKLIRVIRLTSPCKNNRKPTLQGSCLRQSVSRDCRLKVLCTPKEELHYWWKHDNRPFRFRTFKPAHNVTMGLFLSSQTPIIEFRDLNYMLKTADLLMSISSSPMYRVPCTLLKKMVHIN